KDVQMYTGQDMDRDEYLNKDDRPSNVPVKHMNEPIDTNEVISKLDRAYELLKSEKGFKRAIDQLKEKADRLKNRNYTVALFGAFSAGKSSFANALLGEGVLPVSPNPTTA